ncbi:hypothetical protein [Lactobacillus sp. B4005]|uniref:hypothetical protein n=1 Tax=Lactobacillus sp. B4005 TaxID=2818031 RepID=UPI002269F840|nr:hypothetical protein [Lactobacillus sp. B4005]MCX8723045.1 hypothetical protein [Lactobacillus sp. B4005]
MAEWQDTANDLTKQIDENSIWKQIGYMSNNDVDCEPILLSKKHNNDFYPVVIEAPTDLNNPKYDWTKHVWVDQDAANTSVRLTNAEKAIQSAQEQAASATNENKDLKNSLDDIAKSQTEQSKQMAQMLQLLAPAVAKNGGNTNA